MATSEPPQMGYDDALFVNPPSPSLGLHCPICYLILKEPHLLSCCGKHMCQSCLQRVTVVGHPQTCPCCRSEGFQSMLNKEKQATIKGLTVRCMNKTKGCDWTGELGYSQEHLKKRCQYVEIPCQYGCGQRCIRSNILVHEKDQCINRPMEVKLESFMRQLTEKMAVQEREMAIYKREIAELKEQLKKHKSKEKKLESDAERMKQQFVNFQSTINSMLKGMPGADFKFSTPQNYGPTLVAESAAGEVTRLLVSGLVPGTKGLHVEGYLASRGLEVASISEPIRDGKCVVEVTNQLKDMAKFLSKTHKIKQAIVSIKQMEEEEEPPDTIEVHFSDDIIDPDLLHSYFLGPLSGGDDEKPIEWIKIIEPGLCHIKFESPEDAGAVLAKKNHTFMKINFTIRCVKSLVDY